MGGVRKGKPAHIPLNVIIDQLSDDMKSEMTHNRDEVIRNAYEKLLNSQP